MTDLTIKDIKDATVRRLRPGLPDPSGDWIRVKSGDLRGYLLPELGNSVRGRDVLVETLSGHVGPGWVAQTLTVSPITSRWSPGRVTWDDQPTVDAARAVSVVVPSLPDGGIVELPLDGMIQDVANGTAWWGVRVTTNSAADGQKFYARGSGSPNWQLDVVLSDAPDQASNLRPRGGGEVDTVKPLIVAWDFIDLGGDSTEQADSWVQVDVPAAGADPDEVAPDYSSGWQPNLDPQWNLSAIASGPAFAMPAVDVDIHWRVLVRDADGNVPQDDDGNDLWSDWAVFRRHALPTLVVDSPTGVFGDPTPQVLAHLSGGTLKWWKALVTGPDRGDVRYELGRSTGPFDFTIPRRNEDGRRIIKESEGGWLYLRARDTRDRAVAVGQSTYVDTWVPLNLVDDGLVDPPTGLTVEPVTPGDFRMRWRWSRTEAADAWLPFVEDDSIERLELDDVTILAPGQYEWIDSGHVPPFRDVDLHMRAVEVGEKRSAPSTVPGHVHETYSIWLLIDGEEFPIRLRGKVTPDQVQRNDRVATYIPLEGEEVDILYDNPGRTGQVEATVDFRQPVWRDLKAIERLRKSRKRTGRLIYAAESQRVRLRSPDYGPTDLFTPENLQHFVRFGIVEVGD